MHHASPRLYVPLAENFGAAGQREPSNPSGPEMRAVVEAIPDLVIRVDGLGNVLEVNAGRSSGKTAPSDDPAARAEILAAHVNTAFSTTVGRVIATQTMMVIEYPVNHADLTQHFEARIVPVLRTQAVAFIRDITARKRAEEELFASREMLRTILDTIPQRVFWKDTKLTYMGCNRPFAQDRGVAEPADIIGKTDLETGSAEMAERYRADDQEILRSDRAKLNYEEPQERRDGTRRWLRTSKVPLHDKYGRVIGLLGTYDDITERKHADTLRAGQNRVLEMIVAGAPLHETLTHLANVMELLSYGMQCTILLVDSDGQRLRSFVSPSLPVEFSQMVDGLLIAEGYGSCGTAAARRAPVMVSDVRGDPLWERYSDFVERFGVRACWSTPILSRGQNLLGTFAMYFKQPRKPNELEQQLIDVATHLAGIAIQRK